MFQLLQYLVILLTYLGLALGQFSGLRMNRATIALVGATFLINLISNVPAVLVLKPFIEENNTTYWLLLAAGSTLAGNLTLFGSVANLIVAEASTVRGYPLSFKEHLRFGLPLTLITIIMAYLWIK